MNLAIDPDNISESTVTLQDGFRVRSHNLKISDPSDGSSGITMYYIKKGVWIPEITTTEIVCVDQTVQYIDSILLMHSDYCPSASEYISVGSWDSVDSLADSSTGVIGVFDSTVFNPSDDEWYDYCSHKLYEAESNACLVDGGFLAYLPSQYSIKFLELSNSTIIGLRLERVVYAEQE